MFHSWDSPRLLICDTGLYLEHDDIGFITVEICGGYISKCPGLPAIIPILINNIQYVPWNIHAVLVPFVILGLHDQYAMDSRGHLLIFSVADSARNSKMCLNVIIYLNPEVSPESRTANQRLIPTPPKPFFQHQWLFVCSVPSVKISIRRFPLIAHFMYFSSTMQSRLMYMSLLYIKENTI